MSDIFIKPSKALSFKGDLYVILLQALLEASVKRVVNLASQWEKHRAPLVNEHRRVKEMYSNQDVSDAFKQFHFFC